jgi:hypothetical protein
VLIYWKFIKLKLKILPLKYFSTDTANQVCNVLEAVFLHAGNFITGVGYQYGHTNSGQWF